MARGNRLPWELWRFAIAWAVLTQPNGYGNDGCPAAPAVREGTSKGSVSEGQGRAAHNGDYNKNCEREGHGELQCRRRQAAPRPDRRGNDGLQERAGRV